jgi:hypothetical protein
VLRVAHQGMPRSRVGQVFAPTIIAKGNETSVNRFGQGIHNRIGL